MPSIWHCNEGGGCALAQRHATQFPSSVTSTRGERRTDVILIGELRTVTEPHPANARECQSRVHSMPPHRPVPTTRHVGGRCSGLYLMRLQYYVVYHGMKHFNSAAPRHDSSFEREKYVDAVMYCTRYGHLGGQVRILTAHWVQG